MTSLCVIVCVAQKAPGDPGFVLPVMLEKGGAKVLRAEVLAGMLLEMGTGAKSAPKGGLTRLIEAAEARKQRPDASGKFGEGPYKNEPWSIVALRKRVYSMRKFYETTLVDEQSTRETNPGWNDLVVNVLNSFALLLGTKAQHVPKVRGGRWRAYVVHARGDGPRDAEIELRGGRAAPAGAARRSRQPAKLPAQVFRSRHPRCSPLALATGRRVTDRRT